jgi:hypothetical protein
VNSAWNFSPARRLISFEYDKLAYEFFMVARSRPCPADTAWLEAAHDALPVPSRDFGSAGKMLGFGE